jgi:hypothetical protein
MLLAFLEEQLPPEQLAKIEQMLRSDPSLQARMQEAIEKDNQGVHSMAVIWRRSRISCPDREHLGSYMLGALDQPEVDYIQFHLNEVGCQYCQSSLSDLKNEQVPNQIVDAKKRRNRYFESSAGRRRKSTSADDS